MQQSGEIPAESASHNRLPFIAMMSGTLISLIGSQMTGVALPWLVLATTGSAAQAGLVGFAQTVARLIVGFGAGIVVDWYGYRVISICSDLGAAVTLGSIAALSATGNLLFGWLLVLVMLTTFFQVPGESARRRVLPEVGALAGVPLERSNATFESVYQMALLIGPVLSGILIVVVGPEAGIGVDGASFLVSAVLVFFALPLGLLPPVSREAASVRALFNAQRDGFAWLRRDQVTLIMSIQLSLSILLINAPLFPVLLPVLSEQRPEGSIGLGVAFATFAFGALAGSVAFGWVGSALPRWSTWVVRFAVIPLPLWAMATDLPTVLTLISLAACGLIQGVTNPLVATVRFERVPVELRGRVFAALGTVIGVAPPIGILVAGIATDHIGLPATALVLALLAQLLAFFVLVTPSGVRVRSG